jgi:NAD-reducing hydrogenase small subunit
VLREFRANCKTLVAVGACAVNGGIPAMRNRFRCASAWRRPMSTASASTTGIPNDPELPLLLNQVHPMHEVVQIDYFLPGCPPSADAIWTF